MTALLCYFKVQDAYPTWVLSSASFRKQSRKARRPWRINWSTSPTQHKMEQKANSMPQKSQWFSTLHMQHTYTSLQHEHLQNTHLHPEPSPENIIQNRSNKTSEAAHVQWSGLIHWVYCYCSWFPATRCRMQQASQTLARHLWTDKVLTVIKFSKMLFQIRPCRLHSPENRKRKGQATIP